LLATTPNSVPTSTARETVFKHLASLYNYDGDWIRETMLRNDFKSWYKFARDMKLISATSPSQIFVLESTAGDDPTDEFIMYFIDGKMVFCLKQTLSFMMNTEDDFPFNS
jgi:hypothetical protein